MLVKEIMKRPLVVEKDISLTEAADIMSKKGVGSLIFISGGKMKGIVTEKDMIKKFNKKGNISQAMSSRVITVGADENLDRAAEIMRESKIKRLPVVDDGKLVGIITLTDIIANFEALEEDFFFE